MTIDVLVLHLGEVQLPDWHPRAPDGTCVIQGAVVRHPEGVILYDTGVAGDHPLIENLYSPTVVPLIAALHGVGIDERDVIAIVNSHLHFDHCGQNRVFPNVPVWVQQAEYDLIDTPRFTISEWAQIDVDRRRTIDGDAEIADGVSIIATPGHTPGHQALVVTDAETTTVLAGQCCYTCTEFEAMAPAPEDCHDDTWHETAQESIERLHDLRPDVVHLSHDPNTLRSTR